MVVKIGQKLNEIWSEFTRSGITNDLEIIEFVSALLLEEAGITEENELQPRKPPKRLQENRLEVIKSKIKDAREEVGSAGELLDRYLLFKLREMLSGKNYPTPRHIVDSMLRLAKVEGEVSLGDFACGSGGYLVRGALTTSSRRVGYEIAPEWARLAWANLKLHGLNNIQIKNESILTADESEEFDRVVMNPAFGLTVETGNAFNKFGFQIGNISEIALANLALVKLKALGRAVFLTPEGTLFKQGEYVQLRERLVNDYSLKAIINLTKDALQPYSGLSSNIIIADKADPMQQPDEVTDTWFLQVLQDGYPVGKSRDLMTNPGQTSDLPIIEAAVLNSGAEEINAIIRVRNVKNNEGQISGWVIKPFKNEANILRLQTSIEGQKVGFEVVITSPNDEAMVCKIGLGDEEFNKCKPFVPPAKKRSNKEDVELIQPTFRAGKAGQAVLLSADNRVLGVTVKKEEIINQGYNLQVENYLKLPENIIQRRPSGELLGTVRKNQRNLLAKLDALAGRMTMKPIAGETLPPPVMPVQIEGLLSEFAPMQLKIWELVVKEYSSQARYFAIENLPPEMNNNVQITLDLLERMGLIVPVIISGGERDFYYRLTTERDNYRQSSNEAEEEE